MGAQWHTFERERERERERFTEKEETGRGGKERGELGMEGRHWLYIRMQLW